MFIIDLFCVGLIFYIINVKKIVNISPSISVILSTVNEFYKTRSRRDRFPSLPGGRFVLAAQLLSGHLKI